MFEYALYRNQLTKGEDDYSAVPQSPTTKTIEGIIGQITQPGSILKETECVAVIHDFFKAIGANIKEGIGFTSEYLRINPGLSGVFRGIDDQFDPARHRREVHINAGTALKAAAELMAVKKVEGDLRKPVIKKVFDIKGQTAEGTISPGHTLEILGELLKVDPETKDEGVYFIAMSNGQKVYRADYIHTNRPGMLTVLIPEKLSPGDYRLEVRSRLGSTKYPRTGALEQSLIVK